MAMRARQLAMRARQLRPGMQLKRTDGTWVEVDLVKICHTEIEQHRRAGSDFDQLSEVQVWTVGRAGSASYTTCRRRGHRAAGGRVLMDPADLAAMGYKVCQHVGCSDYTKIGLYCKEHRDKIADLAAMGYRHRDKITNREHPDDAVRFRSGETFEAESTFDYETGATHLVLTQNETPTPAGRTFEMFIPVPPVPAARPQVNTQTGHAFTPKRYAEWKKRAAAAVARAVQQQSPLVGEVTADVLVSRDGIFVKLTEVNQPRPRGLQGDIDNYLKGALDALTQGGAIGDDKAVVETRARFWQ